MKILKHALLAAAAYGKGLPAKKLRNGLFVVAAFAGLAGLIGLTDPPQSAAGPGPSNVIVVNTPLPVSGTVSAKAAQSGLWNVGITGTPTVNVGTLPAVSISGTPSVSLAPGASFRDADNAARQPFQSSWGCSFTGGTSSCTDTTSIVVPTGKELVIEFVNMFAVLPSPAKGEFVSFGVAQGGITVGYILPFNFIFDNGSVTTSAAGQQTRLYADPSTNVSVQCNVTAISASGFCSVSVSGYLVNVP